MIWGRHRQGDSLDKILVVGDLLSNGAEFALDVSLWEYRGYKGYDRSDAARPRPSMRRGEDEK